MSVQLRNVGFEISGPQPPRIKRAAGVLSDGSAVMLVGDSNQAGISGDGGDNTGVPKLYVYHSSNRESWTLKNTITISGTGTPVGVVASMAVDAADNLHLAWKNSNGGLTYKKLTFAAGPTWSAGSDSIVVSAPPTDWVFHGVDVDALGTSSDRVVVVTYSHDLVGTRSTAIRAYVRRADNAWTAQTVQTTVSGDSMKALSDDISVAADQQAIGGDNIALFAVHVVRLGAVTSKDFGDVVYMYKTNVSTGATQNVALGAGPFNAGRGGGRRRYWLWNSGPDKWVLGGVSGYSPWESTVFAFTWNRTTNTRTSLDIPARYGSHGTIVATNHHQWTAAAYNKADQTVMVFGYNNSYSYSAVIRLDQANGTSHAQSGPQRWDNSFRYAGVVPPTALWSGSQSRNTHAGSFDTSIFFWKYSTTKAYRVYAHTLKAALAPASISPPSNALISTDRPLLSARHLMTQDYSQQQYRFEWQLATDAGFSVNVRTVIEPISDFISANLTTLPNNTTTTSTELIGAISELFTGTWFIRARSLGAGGSVGPWTAGHQFTVSHPPVAGNLVPTGNQIIVLDPSNLATVSWQFSDPSPYDSQTAYQVVVEVNDTLASVADTGKVTSTSQQASVTIPTPNKNTLLRWRVRLWDSDDVSGPYSSDHLFIAADAPDPDILAPIGTVTDGTPIVSWDPGVTGDQLQTSFQVLVTQGNLVLHDSGWLFGDDTSYQIPLGILHNATDYSITVRIRDNFGLEGFDTEAITTAWTPPASPTGLMVYLSEYARRGFVYLVQDINEIDEDYVKYNLYRRKYGEPTWTLVTEWTDAVATPLVYRDYLVGSGETYEYTVTQVIDSFGDFMESAITADQVFAVTPQTDKYWLLDPEEIETESLPLFSVTAEPFVDEYEQETYQVIGRGRHTDYGDRLGYAGSLSCQLRDRVSTGVEITNHALNPAMQIISAGSTVPDRWYVVEQGGPINYLAGLGHTTDPSPTGKILVPEIFVIDMPDGAIIQLEQQLELPELPLAVVGNTVSFSVWVYDETPLGSGTQWRLEMAVLDAGFNVLASMGSHTLSPIEFYTSSALGSPDYNNPTGPLTGVWRRLSIALTWPAGAPAYLHYKVGARNSSGGLKTGGFRVAGAQVEIGAVRPYVDGNQLGALWLGEPQFAPSYTSGDYTARQQRLALEAMRQRKRSIFIRNPFGDIFRASTGNISVDRIAGTGRTEFTDIEIPYSEVYE